MMQRRAEASGLPPYLGPGGKSTVFSSSSDALGSIGRLSLPGETGPESLGDLVNFSCFNTILILMTQRRGSATQRCPNPQGP